MPLMPGAAQVLPRPCRPLSAAAWGTAAPATAEAQPPIAPLLHRPCVLLQELRHGGDPGRQRPKHPRAADHHHTRGVPACVYARLGVSGWVGSCMAVGVGLGALAPVHHHTYVAPHVVNGHAPLSCLRYSGSGATACSSGKLVLWPRVLMPSPPLQHVRQIVCCAVAPGGEGGPGGGY